MSTTTVSFRSTTLDTGIEMLRRREGEARAAARRVAQRAEAERRREEAIKRRIKAANKLIVEQEARFQEAVARHDEAARRLPDLSLSVPRLAAISSAITEDPAKLEVYATQLATEIEQFSRRLDGAIAEAELLLKRRIAKAAAWRSAADLEQQIDLLNQRSRDVAARMHAKFSITASPAKPHPEAELEVVMAYEGALQQRHSQVKNQYESLQARAQSRESAVALSGAQVQTHSAEKALNRHEAEHKTRAVAVLQLHRDTELVKAGLRLDDLTGAVQAQLDVALEQAPLQDYRTSVTRWIAREKQHRDGIARALSMIQGTPDLLHDDPLLSRRWMRLTTQLQRISSGLEDFSPSVEREYEQICADARRLINIAFTRADWVQAMSEQGFEIFEREDGQGLVVVDLDNPEVWLEATEYEAEQGGFAAQLELKTDAASSPAVEAKITEDICSKLGRAAGSTKPDVTISAEVVERKSRITRGHRPSKARKTFTQR